MSRQISQSLKLNVTPEFLKLNYYNLLKKYKFLSKRKKRSGVQWFYYKEFDKYYNKPAVQCDIEEESLIQENFEVIYEATNLENSEEKMQFLADNFMDICKVCLEESNTLNSIESSDLINKMNFLFFDDVSHSIIYLIV